MKQYLKHLFENILLWNLKAQQFERMKKVHTLSGVLIDYYQNFELKQGIFLRNTPLPKSVNKWSIVDYKRLTRKGKRNLAKRTLGASQFATRAQRMIAFLGMNNLKISKIDKLLKKLK